MVYSYFFSYKRMMRNREIVSVEIWVGADNVLNSKSSPFLTQFSTTWSPKQFPVVFRRVSWDRRSVGWIIPNGWRIRPFGKVRTVLHKGPFAIVITIPTPSNAFENLFESKLPWKQHIQSSLYCIRLQSEMDFNSVL